MSNRRLFSLSLADGAVREKNTAKATPTKWTEDVLQYVLALNPGLLGVADHLPLALDGGSTSVSMDQLYVDELGRLVIVEVKNERAGLTAMAQLLSYSKHWRGLPIGEMELAFKWLAQQGTGEDVLGEALSGLRTWARARRGEPRATGGGRRLDALAPARKWFGPQVHARSVGRARAQRPGSAGAPRAHRARIR